MTDMRAYDEMVDAALKVEEGQIPELQTFYGDILEKEPNHVPALFGSHILSIRTGDIDMALTYYQKVFALIEYHPSTIKNFVRHLGNMENVVNLGCAYRIKYPSEPFGYLLELMAYYGARDVVKCRDLFVRCYENSNIGIHFQPSLVSSIFDAARGESPLSVTSESLPPKIAAEIAEITGKGNELGEHLPDTPQIVKSPDTALNISTLEGEVYGLEGSIFNGKISGATTPTIYYFKYGASPAELDKKTRTHQVPPGRFGKLRETGGNLFRRINAFALTLDFVEVRKKELNIGSASMKFEGPFGNDRDHLDGIGIIDLMLGWETAVHLRGSVPSAFDSKEFPKPIYPGEVLDLRDAIFTITYRADEFDAKGFYPVAWVHGGSGKANYPTEAENYAAWAYTDDLGSLQIVADSEWRRSEITFDCNSSAWSFCGSNIEEMGPTMERICYHPIGEVLRENRIGNICLCFVCGDEMKPPEGDIEIGALELSYRSYSLLAPNQGIELISWPENSPSDPGILTGGWIGSIEQCWQSEESPKDVQEFVWRFRESATIQSVRLHNNPLNPAKEITLSISDDGETFREIWNGRLKNVPRNPVAWPKHGETGVSFNFATVVVFDEPVTGRFLRLGIKSGYRWKYWGLDAIEVFGAAPAFIPSPEPLTISEEALDLEPGPLFVQLVAENEAGRTEGDIVEITRPSLLVPIISRPVVIARTKNTAKVRFRTNTMGEWGELSGSIYNSEGGNVASQEVLIGRQEAARETILIFDGLTPDASYQGEAVAINAHGKSLSCSFTVPAEEI